MPHVEDFSFVPAKQQPCQERTMRLLFVRSGCLVGEVGDDCSESAGFVGGCRIKASRRWWPTLAVVGARAAVCDDAYTDDPRATDGLANFGACP